MIRIATGVTFSLENWDVNPNEIQLRGLGAVSPIFLSQKFPSTHEYKKANLCFFNITMP